MAFSLSLQKILSDSKNILRVYLYRVRERSARRKLESSLQGFTNKNIFLGEDLSMHYGDEELPDLGLQHVIKSFTIERINFILEMIKTDFETQSFADLGDSDGLFLRALGKDMLSVNISLAPLNNIKGKGVWCLRADIGRLPLIEGAFHHVLFFQALEHMTSPIDALKEVNRICKKSAFVSIPYVSKTNIHRYNYDPDRPIFQHHIFEFDEKDFQSIVSHTGFKISSDRIVEVFDKGWNPLDRVIFAIWRVFMGDELFCGCFQKFRIYHLVKD